jgi:hypothetical protein
MYAVGNVPEWYEVYEFNCPATAYDGDKWEAFESRSAAPCEAHSQVAAPVALTEPRADIATGGCEPGSKRVCACDVATGVLGANSGASISNVLVLGTQGAPPLKRMEIHFEDPKQVPAILKLLAVTLQSSGFYFRAVRNPFVPATDIWLTSPLGDSRRTLLSCAATVAE